MRIQTAETSGRRLRSTSTVAVTTVVMLVVLASSAPATATVSFDLSRSLPGRTVMADPRNEDQPTDPAALARMVRRLMSGGHDGSLSFLVSRVWAGQRATILSSVITDSADGDAQSLSRSRRGHESGGVIMARGRVHARLLNLPPPMLSLLSVR